MSMLQVSGATLLKEKDTPKFAGETRDKIRTFVVCSWVEAEQSPAAGLLNFELGFAFKPLVWEFSIKRRLACA